MPILRQTKLELIRQLMRERLEDAPTISEMAEVAGYSTSHFLLLFRNCTGLSPHRYLIRMRIEKARELLTTTSLSLAAITADCGFADQSHLIRVFKRIEGMTPDQFRRMTKTK